MKFDWRALAPDELPSERRLLLLLGVASLFGQYDTHHLGRDEEMRRECDELLSHVPHLTLSHVHRMHPGLGDALVEGLQKAGLPE